MFERYRRTYGPDVDLVAAPVVVERDPIAPECYVLDEYVSFGRPDTAVPGRTRWLTGNIALFLRLLDPVLGRQVFAVILADGPDGAERQYRVPVTALAKAV